MIVIAAATTPPAITVAVPPTITAATMTAFGLGLRPWRANGISPEGKASRDSKHWPFPQQR